MASTSKAATTWWWLSFCDLTSNTFVGVCIVEGAPEGGCMCAAVQRAWCLGCNPGGEVLGRPLSADRMRLLDPRWRNRLLSSADVDEL
ncbi:MAG: hypothetical protein ACRELB_12875, partial [Polyangiaceae bacterium]